MINDNQVHLALLDDAEIIGRVCVIEPEFTQAISIPASGLSGLNVPGTKCVHGVYIPANSPYPTLSDYCSCCWQYLLAVKPHGTYLATKKLEVVDEDGDGQED